MDQHLFISYSSRDKTTAFNICDYIESKGIQCWIAPRNIQLGKDYGEAIVDAIEASFAFILILSDNANLSKHIKNEVERAVNYGKSIFTIRIREVQPSKALELFVSSSHWLDAWSPPLEQKLNQLVDAIKVLGGINKKNDSENLDQSTKDVQIKPSENKNFEYEKLLKEIPILAAQTPPGAAKKVLIIKEEGNAILVTFEDYYYDQIKYRKTFKLPGKYRFLKQDQFVYGELSKEASENLLLGPYTPEVALKLAQSLTRLNQLLGDEYSIKSVNQITERQSIEQNSEDEKSKSITTNHNFVKAGEMAPKNIVKQETKIAKTPSVPNSQNFLFAKNAVWFDVGDKKSKTRSFGYVAGTSIQFIEKDSDSWFLFRSTDDKDIWLQNSYEMYLENTDRRRFFKIAEIGHVGYLVEIWGPPHGSAEFIRIEDNLLGDVEIKSEQITSLIAKKGEISVNTKDIGTFSGSIKQIGNFNCNFLTMGPCLVTTDAIIALVRTNRTNPLTLSPILDSEKPLLKDEKIYWDRTQFKFRLMPKDSIGHFDERVKESYLQVIEQTLGWMRISIPRIKRITVDPEFKEASVIIETLDGNIYKGTCQDQFNLSGTIISFDKVKKLTLEPIGLE